MRHRRVIYRSATLSLTSQPWPFAAAWEHESLRLLVHPRWRPAADIAETRTTLEVTVDLAGLDEDDFEVQLFQNGLVVEGRRPLPESAADAVYHAAGIPRGAFRLELPLPVAFDHERVEARYERGLLTISLPKRS
ncbi:MAG TPA: Hsp20/alpha crystallin family protein [Methylomirabilota bacterium]|jgi:HSP20 family molecular chaperone IbpA|nr:Hsp20/alpha crystallin family protein [Methylomirabilota bacterium]